MPKHTDYTGEKAVNSDGYEMVVIECPNAHNMTIQFTADGLIRRHIYYTDFVRGKVRHKFEPQDIIGLRKQMNNGSWCTIVDASSLQHCEITFDNGYKTVASFDRFTKGEIGNGYKRSTFQNMTGTIRVSKHGEKYTVVAEFEKSGKGFCGVRFENGEVKTCSRKSVLANTLSSDTRAKQTTSDSSRRRMENKPYNGTHSAGKTIVSKDGSVWTITREYERGKYVDAVNQYGHTMERVFPSNIRRKHNPAIAVYGEKFVANTGETCTIIGGEEKGDLTVQTEDGLVYCHQKYYLLKKGVISGRGHTYNTVAAKRYRTVGQTIMQNVGMEATCIEYVSARNITIQFENGETVKTANHLFQRGVVVPPSLEKSKRMSLNEFTLLYGLERYGFIHAKAHSLRDVGLENYELDIFHPGLKIAIEYDGAIHGIQNLQDKDIQKDILCQKAGIDIYRLREGDAGLLSDGISKELWFRDCHSFGPDVREVFSRLIELLNAEHHLNIELPDLTSRSVIQDIREKFYNNVTYLSKVGEQRKNKQGYLMTLIAYRGAHDCDIAFENGYISQHRSYSVFTNGTVQRLENHFGETFINNRGEEIKVISNRFGQNVDVEFTDGTVRHNVCYCYLIKGTVINKNIKFSEIGLQEHIGETVLCANGMNAEIVDIFHDSKGHLMVRAKFEDGITSGVTAYSHFKEGYVKHPNFSGNSEKAYFLFQSKGVDSDDALRWRKNLIRTDHLGNVYPSRKALCEAYHVNPSTFVRREKCGWTLEECLLGRNQENIS